MKKINIVNLTVYMFILSCINILLFSTITYAPSAKEYERGLIQISMVVGIIFLALTITLLVFTKIKPEFISKIPRSFIMVYLLVAILATLFTLATGLG